MPPTPKSPSPPHQPRVVLYHQTHYTSSGEFISALPLISECNELIGVTHLIIAAFHLNAAPGDITLNDDPPLHPKHAPVWEEVRVFQDVGVKVLGMLGGAAKGTFTRLDQDEEAFEAYYGPLRDIIKEVGLDGLDLDVEEEMSLAGIIRLIDRVKEDFGPNFLITMAPVANAMIGGKHLSGFDYQALEVMRADKIDCYHTQFYNNWGRVEGLGQILATGWRPEKIVVGVLTNPGNGHGFVGWEELGRLLRTMKAWCPGFGGVMGWEYYNCLTWMDGRPWEWGEAMMKVMRDYS